MRLKKYIYSLRRFRVFHRYLGLTLATLLAISAVTGVLLALKKDVEFLQPPTQKGITNELTSWKQMSEIAAIGQQALAVAHPDLKNNPIKRIDARPSKGVAKIIFENGNWEVQIDASSGKVLSIGKRYSDWIESLHDGSIISDLFKLISMNFLGVGLLILIGSGLWLWYGPKRYRELKRRRRESKGELKIKN